MSTTMGDAAPRWRPMRRADLAAVERIGEELHADLPERPEVVAEKFDRFPRGCLTLAIGEDIVGYGLSHPWRLRSAPKLDSFLGPLPDPAECLFIHDVAVLPRARGHDAAGCYVGRIALLAAELGVAALALVSVYGTHEMWARHGFRAMGAADLDAALSAYGRTARYMVKALRPPA